MSLGHDHPLSLQRPKVVVLVQHESAHPRAQPYAEFCGGRRELDNNAGGEADGRGDLGVGGAAQAGAASAELSQVSMLAGDSTSAKHSMAAITPHHNVIAKDVSEDCVWL